LPIQQARIERVKLRDLPQAKVEMEDTVVVPPAGPLQPNTEIRARLAELDRAEVVTAQVDIL
jgi:enhancing lycopene biosynthesis protein 2